MDAPSVRDNEYAERSLAAAILMGYLRPSSLDRDIFVGERELAVFDACLQLELDGVAISPMTAMDHMGASRNVVGDDLIAWSEYVDAAPLEAVAHNLVDTLRDAQIERRMAQLGRAIAKSTPEEAPALLSAGLSRMPGPTGHRNHQTLQAVGRALQEQMARPGRRLPAPWRQIEMMGSIGAGEVMIVAALPGHGKSALAQQWGEFAAEQGHPVLFVSLEMAAILLAVRSASRRGSINSKAILRDARYAKDIERVLADVPELFQVDDSAHTAEQIHATVTAWHRNVEHDGPVPLVIVDHLQHFDTKDGEDTVSQVQGAIALCNRIAKELDVAVIALSQLNKDKEIGNKRPPRSSDLWGGMQLWQRAASVLLLWMEGDRTARQRPARLLVDKARNGDVGAQIDLTFEGRFTRFSEAPPQVF
ncbi:MAG: hypothetical protein B7733_05740 [Myxococcales bacterium FL481]|nr:MAG: hypothetical protein B7733_05740 [Myxococcales bacterium FL481]